MISRVYTFEAAHKLTKVAPDHKCARLHGHSFSVEVFVRCRPQPQSPLDERDMIEDYADIDRAWQPIFARVDHNYLNDVDVELKNPTSEIIACWIYDKMTERFEELKLQSAVDHVVVKETPRSSARWPLEQ